MPLQSLLWLLPLGLLIGLLELPLQLISELGFVLQRQQWALPGLARSGGVPAVSGLGVLVVFAATAALLALAWSTGLGVGRGGGLAPVLALDRAPKGLAAEREQAWLAKLSLRVQLARLPLLLLTHLGGLSVGVESPSAALGASALLAIRRRWPQWKPLAAMPLPLVAVIGGSAGLGAAFRSPLLAAAYGLEELGRHQGLPLVLPSLVIAGVGGLLNSGLGQPARLPGLLLGPLAPGLWGWVLLLTLAGCGLGALLVRLLIPLAGWVQLLMAQCRWLAVPLISALLALIALASGGLSLNDGSLSLQALLQGKAGGGVATWGWRWLASLVSVATAAPGGLMHDAMTLGALLTTPLHGMAGLDARVLAQLAAVGATALFAAVNGTPVFCAVFVFTLQGDPSSLPLLLLVSAVSVALAERLRGEGWNAHQALALLR